MKAICPLEGLIKVSKEYEKNNVETVCVEIVETGGIIISPGKMDVPSMKIEGMTFR